MEETNNRTVKVPGPEHPITITRDGARVIATAAGRVIADSRATFLLCEASYEPVRYFPREDVDMRLLERSTSSTYCPYKGDCGYFDLIVDATRRSDAVWTYEQPYPAVDQIRGHVAFYPEALDVLEVTA